MAEGVRIRLKPEWARNVPDGALIVEQDITKPNPAPTKPHKRGQRIPTLEEVQPVCSRCGVQHFFQTWHLQLRAGSVLVSVAMWDKLKTLTPQRWEFADAVAEPPTQHMTPDKPAELLEKVPQPIWLPGSVGNGHRVR